MKNVIYVLLLGVLIILFSGCATTQKSISFKDSNAYFMQENIKKIDLNEITKTLTKEENVVLVSTETEDTFDFYLNATIEDVVLKKLVDAGYNVLERDNDLIYRLISESETNYSHYLKNKRKLYMNSGSVGVSSSSYYNPFQPSSNLSGSLFASGANAFEKENFDEIKIETKLITADKILAYRVIENGIIYEDESETFTDSLNRVAYTILSFRIEDANTGKIISMKNIEQTSSDVISRKNKKLIENFHYKNYPFSYPNIYGNPSQTEYKKEGKWNAPKTGWILVSSAGIGLIILLVISVGS